jgi:hypothetical protein
MWYGGWRIHIGGADRASMYEFITNHIPIAVSIYLEVLICEFESLPLQLGD